MPRTWTCPWFVREEKRCVVCRKARLRFSSAGEFDAFCRSYCASVTGWQDCTIARHCEDQYEHETEG